MGYENLAFLVDTLDSVQKIRQSTGNRIYALKGQGREDKIIEVRHKELQELEDRLVDDIIPNIKSHPAWKWGSRVLGIGPENFAKVVGKIEKVTDGDKRGVECFDTPSKLCRFCGVAGELIEKRKQGEKLHHSTELKGQLWRVATNLKMAKGKFYEFYLKEREYLEGRYERDGIRIMSTPKGKFCPKCAIEIAVKTAKFCPVCGSALEKKIEPSGIIFAGHHELSALRRMIRMFVIMLYTAWREELGLPVRVPYPIEHLGHSKIFTPEDFCDR